MSFYEILVYVILLGGLAISIFIEKLNLKNISDILPSEFVGWYDQEKYKKSQDYLRENVRFGFLTDFIFTPLLVLFIFMGGFNYIDQFARSWGYSDIVTGLIFTGTLGVLSWILHLPFNLYDTFVIEEKYGFNKTTPKIFALDTVKGLVLSIVIGAPVLTAIFWFFQKYESWGWLYVWIFLIAVQLFMMYIAPVTIMPLFNKFKPLDDGELKNKINDFAQAQNFKLQGIFVMDGSRRSTKANAYFTGFGRFRRIVLFDTLIAKQTVDELVAVLAHEIGHYKMRHIPRQLILSILTLGLTLFVMGLFINNAEIFSAFKMENVSVYASLVFFGIFYSPISSLISLYSLYLSRKYEFEADKYAVDTFQKPESLVTALKKLSVDNLSNLTPHPLKVFLEYTHPPILQRIAVLNSFRHRS